MYSVTQRIRRQHHSESDGSLSIFNHQRPVTRWSKLDGVRKRLPRDGVYSIKDETPTAADACSPSHAAHCCWHLEAGSLGSRNATCQNKHTRRKRQCISGTHLQHWFQEWKTHIRCRWRWLVHLRLRAASSCATILCFSPAFPVLGCLRRRKLPVLANCSCICSHRCSSRGFQQLAGESKIMYEERVRRQCTQITPRGHLAPAWGHGGAATGVLACPSRTAKWLVCASRGDSSTQEWRAPC
jgi:hypothetical protein